jgi:S-adenosylmethionine decarboxylase proenzyme
MKHISGRKIKDALRINEYTGRKIGKLTLIRRATEEETHNKARTSKGKKYWVCSCECGRDTIVRESHLITDSRKTQSCGCISNTTKSTVENGVIKERVIKHKGEEVRVFPGKKFGRLTALTYKGFLEHHGKKRSQWLLQCECGEEVTRIETQLFKGQSSCRNCRKKTHGLSHSPTWRSYTSMMSRCYRPDNSSYKRYGGVGITVCDRWKNSFSLFLEDMGERPKGKTLDRKNPFGNYSPENCRWATPEEQEKNKKRDWIDKIEDVDFILSQHLTADLFDCDKHLLDKKEFVEEILKEAARLSGSNIIHSFSYEFKPQGLSSILVLSESHISFHSFPEKRSYTAVDLFTCAKNGNPLEAVVYLSNKLNAKGVSISQFKRGNALGVLNARRFDFYLQENETLRVHENSIKKIIFEENRS